MCYSKDNSIFIRPLDEGVAQSVYSIQPQTFWALGQYVYTNSRKQPCSEEEQWKVHIQVATCTAKTLVLYEDSSAIVHCQVERDFELRWHNGRWIVPHLHDLVSLTSWKELQLWTYPRIRLSQNYTISGALDLY